MISVSSLETDAITLVTVFPDRSVSESEAVTSGDGNLPRPSPSSKGRIVTGGSGSYDSQPYCCDSVGLT